MRRFIAYQQLPPEAAAIREQVFIEEQGFAEEFDETDRRATHLLLYQDGTAQAVCRYFPAEQPGVYIFGRLAVLPQFRGRGLGAALLSEAEQRLRAMGARQLRLAAQLRAQGFYRKQGYWPDGEVFLDEGCPHIWMSKLL